MHIITTIYVFSLHAVYIHTTIYVSFLHVV